MTTQEQERAQLAWDRIATGYDEFVTPTHLELGEECLRLAGLRRGMRFVDVAAGSGALSIPAARLGARVLATDISPVMLERLEARAQTEGLELQTRVMNGHALELEDESFDVCGSQFGVMLFADMPRGISEMARVTRPGGRVLMTVLGTLAKVEFFAFLIAAIRSAVPEFTGPPTDPPPLPFQLQDPERLRRELTRAGLGVVHLDTTTEALEFDSGEQMWNWLVNSNPIAGEILDELDLTDDETAAVRERLADLVRERARGSGSAKLTSPINIGVATK